MCSSDLTPLVFGEDFILRGDPVPGQPELDAPLVFVGFGSIGQGVLPLILRHIGGMTPDRITIVTAEPAGAAEAAGGRGGGNPRLTAMNNAFFAVLQHDFAARLKWSVTPNFKDANHEPMVKIVGSRDLDARVGATVNLRGSVSDPDNNKVTTKWWQYNEAGTYTADIAVADANALETSFRVPDDATPGQTIHFILEATDDGTPTLTRYQRVVVTVRP